MRIRDLTELPAHLHADVQRQLNGYPHCSNPPPAAGAKPPAAALPKKPAKYRNVKVTIDGETYDSKLEYLKHVELKRRQVLGEVGRIFRQVPFVLEGGVVYRADYVVTTGVAPDFCEVWDAKGKDTQASINKRKQVLARHSIEVRLWRGNKGGEK